MKNKSQTKYLNTKGTPNKGVHDDIVVNIVVMFKLIEIIPMLLDHDLLTNLKWKSNHNRTYLMFSQAYMLSIKSYALLI